MVESPTPPELNVDAASFITWYNTLEDDPTIVRLFDRKVGHTEVYACMQAPP